MERGPYEGKYKKLTNYLVEHESPVEHMTFEQIEGLLDFLLPTSARRHQAWWANQPRGQSLAWIRAGYRTSNVSIADGKLTFVRVDQIDPHAEEPLYQDKTPASPLSITEAKERLARTFGVDPSQIEITIRA